MNRPTFAGRQSGSDRNSIDPLGRVLSELVRSIVTTARRHHTVPRLYLARFGDASLAAKNPHVWVTDAQTGKARHSSVLNQSVVNDFYGPFEDVLRDEVDTAQIVTLFDQIEAGNAFQMPGE